MDSSDDKQGPGNLEFNEMTDMENVRLAKGMKFPNSQVFRKALREYVIQHHIDVKWKLNEKKKISVHCKNNYGWRCYASMVTGECTFDTKTLYPECTCPLTFKNGNLHQPRWQKGIWRILVRILIGRSQVLSTM